MCYLLISVPCLNFLNISQKMKNIVIYELDFLSRFLYIYLVNNSEIVSTTVVRKTVTSLYRVKARASYRYLLSHSINYVKIISNSVV